MKLGTVVDLDPLSKPVEVLIMGSIGRGSGLRLWLVQRRRFAFPESECTLFLACVDMTWFSYPLLLVF